MRTLIFIGIVAIGALGGLLSAANDDWATRVVMAAVGAAFLAPVAGLVAPRLNSRASPRFTEEDASSDSPGAPRSLVSNYWRDRGHPPFMKPQDAVPDKHMFDPDKLG